MNQTEDRIVIRDTYGYKIYEIFLEDGALSCSDYILGRRLTADEAEAFVEVFQGINFEENKKGECR